METAVYKSLTLKKAIFLAKKGYYKAALKHLRELEPSTLRPVHMSYYALCVAMVKKDYEGAITLGIKAVRAEFYNPEIYLNLGRILSASGKKAFAFRAYQKGLGYDSNHPGLVKELSEMGMRRPPVVAFLSRENPLNRFSGLLIRKVPFLGKWLFPKDGTSEKANEKLFRTRYY